MAEHLLKGPDSVSVTSTPQAITLPETDCWYSIRNSGSGSVYYFTIDISDYTAATYTSKTAAQLRTAGCGMVASGESVSVKTDMPTIYLVCADGVTATANIEPGVISSTVNVEANLGNVGLLNAAESEINPATEDTLATIDADTGNIANYIGATTTTKADVDGNGAANAHLRRIGFEADRAGDLLTTIDADTGNVADYIGATTTTKADVDGNGAANAHLRRIGFEADRAGDLLTTIDADTSKIPSQGSAPMATSTPVTIATDDILTSVTKGAATAASGQHLDNAGAGTAANTSYSVTVVASATYRVTAVNGIIYLGIADTTAADSAVLWAIPAGQTQILTIPSGTSLYYHVSAAGVEGRLARIQ